MSVIVTGAAGGIGSEIMWSLLRGNERVVVVDRKSPHTTVMGLDVKWIQGDVREAAVRERALGAAEDCTGLVNAAGVTFPYATYGSPGWRETMETNFEAAYAFSYTAACAHDALARKLSIVNIGSIGASRAFPGNPSYQASKAALLAATRSMALDWAASGIRVNSVSPGYTRTPMTHASWVDETARRVRTDRTMLGRWAQPRDIAQAVLFLLDEEAAGYITGVDLPVDGGWLAKGM